MDFGQHEREAIGELLKEFRERSGKTQEEFASALGLKSRIAYHNYESGKRLCPYRKLLLARKIARVPWSACGPKMDRLLKIK